MPIKVHHSSNMRDTSFFGHADIITTKKIITMFKDGEYQCVAKVDTDDMDVAFELTNNLSTPWIYNNGVDAKPCKAGQGIRSTSVGDILETEDGVFIVAGHGFDKLDVS